MSGNTTSGEIRVLKGVARKKLYVGFFRGIRDSLSVVAVMISQKVMLRVQHGQQTSSTSEDIISCTK